MNKSSVPFIETSITGKEPAWCVDGRRDVDDHQPGPHMLGGSLHPIVVSSVFKNSDCSEDFITSSTDVLKENGYGIGVHRGSHYRKEDGISDCGFADNLPKIIQKSQDKQDEIMQRIISVYEENKAAFPDLTRSFLGMILHDTYRVINAYNVEKFTCTGDALITLEEEKEHAEVEHLEGEHEETCVFINLKTDTTLDTNKMNGNRSQAFNLDLWGAVAQSRALGVDEIFATASSLILYVATEMVLVEDKGKDALDVVVHV